ncbi:MAG: exosome complex exonuclease Rrp41 [DPANN group archaeon]|nr:exosome complex exonuclease Rrp41 [DPANN group archaeon]
MVYEKRLDGRKFDELRPIEARAGIIKRADGSGYFRIGKSSAYAAVYGPRELYPRFLQNPTKGVLRCHYNMMPFSSVGGRVRPGGSRRSKEISMVTNKALLSVMELDDFTNAVIDVFIELDQTDAGTRCAGISAASIALADAGIVMKDLVSAVAIGVVDNSVVADLNYDEEAYDKGDVADIPFAVIPSTGKISLLQMDGIITKEQLNEAMELAQKKCGEINRIQRAALKDKFKAGENHAE